MSQEKEHSEIEISKRAFEDTFTASTDNLSETFDAGFESYNNLNKTEKPTNNSEIQLTIKHLMKTFENATKLVSLVDIFSDNECLEEIATENLKYFLLPALLGTLTTKICDPNSRLQIIDTAEIYFIDFLKRLKSYKLIDVEVPEIKCNNNETNIDTVPLKSSTENLSYMVKARNTKIQRYKNQKELETKLKTFQENVHNPNIDEEFKREYFITLLKIHANQAIEELSSLASERPILDYMKNLEQDSSSTSNKTSKQKETLTKLHPIIITRDAVQKKIFGAGYPSLPVLTVEEFYDQKVKDGEWSNENTEALKHLKNTSSCNVDFLDNSKEDKEKGDQIEKDDSDTLVQERAMDEYKDNHRRGWGNRYNRS